MVHLAADLGVSRATLYRWTGDRERLLADAVWAEAYAIAENVLRANRRKSGLSLILVVCVDFLDYFAQRGRQRVLSSTNVTPALSSSPGSTGAFAPGSSLGSGC